MEQADIGVWCTRVVAVLTPAFMESSECLEEYNMAMCCNQLTSTDVLAPFYLDTIKSLPSYMGLVQWIDCRSVLGLTDQLLHVNTVHT